MQSCGYLDNSRDTIAETAKNIGYKAIESFCGPGGMSLGLSWAGFDVAVSFDVDAPSVATHNRNLPGHCFVGDARKVTGKELMHLAGVKPGELALFAGGPPCQGFSKQRRGGHLGDERNDLVLDYIRLVEEIKPRFLLFENVAIFGQLRGKRYLAEMQERLSNYHLVPHFYNAADYGLPQTRERFIVVGERRDQEGDFSIPLRTVAKWRTVGEVLSDLPEPPLDYSVHPLFANHQRAKVTAINIERFSHVPQGGGWRNIPEHLRLPCHQGVDPSSGGWPDVYGRLRFDGQCPTITGGFDSFTRGRYGHPTQDRPITPREAARMQGFPDSFVFEGNRGDVRSQIGNVVPPPLAEAVGIEVLRALLISDGYLSPDMKIHTTARQTELDLVE
ncbi:DNA cytosine methyltransferase [Herbaspirillum rubrisubalbicans]|jgi:DNA (cytosine-5)-methyltransferase 1|uniref:DNA (cytosine-5-)-methyltransferase n=3 Tax=Herbaspirillum TaxID=963 RepID=A0AAD0U6N1_9BURK|nr:DNA cytosine methyltransferase [Herbaspirillum rubrisubalbicans]